MDKIQIRKLILEEIFPDNYYNSSKEEFVTWCFNKDGCNGKHHKKKLQINLEKNVFNCWVCSFSGFISKILSEKATKSQKDRYFSTIDDFVSSAEEDKHLKIDYPDTFKLLFDSFNNKLAVNSYLWLIENTNLSDEQIFQLKIGFCSDGDYRNRLIFPSYDEDGSLNFYNSRDIRRTDNWKYLNCPGVSVKDIIFNEILIDWRKPLIIVEGVKAYLRHFGLENIVPIFGKKFSREFLLFKKSIMNDIPKVYVALDYEEKFKAYNIMEDYKFYGIDSRIIDLKEENQADEISTFKFVEKMQSANPFSKKELMIARLENIRNNL